jgi:tetratricopeptide (TPR) repeat protein
MFQLQSGDFSGAKRSADIALGLQTNSAAAFLALGRVQLAMGQTNAALASIGKAAGLNHLPDSQWLLADVLRAGGKTAEAAAVEGELQKRGVSEDPRSFSLYLATRGIRLDVALSLAQRELDTRSDVFTHDAVAWALQANGRLSEARAEMTKALAEGTQDARLFFHAAVISDAAGDKTECARCLRLASNSRQMLFPSEQEHLARLAPGEEFSQQYTSGLKPN